MKTYTIATANDMLIAIVPDGQDIAAEVARTAQEAGVTFDDYDTISCLVLTDEPLDDDQIVVYGDKMGRITDEDGIGYGYAVKRRDDVAERLQGMRRSDAELGSYFGVRAGYLQQLREDLEAAKARLAGGFAADDERSDPVFGFLGAEDPALWQKQREGVIRQLKLTLAANL